MKRAVVLTAVAFAARSGAAVAANAAAAALDLDALDDDDDQSSHKVVPVVTAKGSYRDQVKERGQEAATETGCHFGGAEEVVLKPHRDLSRRHVFDMEPGAQGWECLGSYTPTGRIVGGRKVYLQQNPLPDPNRLVASTDTGSVDLSVLPSRKRYFLFYSTDSAEWAVGANVGKPPFCLSAHADTSMPTGLAGNWHLGGFDRCTKGMDASECDSLVNTFGTRYTTRPSNVESVCLPPTPAPTPSTAEDRALAYLAHPTQYPTPPPTPAPEPTEAPRPAVEEGEFACVSAGRKRVECGGLADEDACNDWSSAASRHVSRCEWQEVSQSVLKEDAVLQRAALQKITRAEQAIADSTQSKDSYLDAHVHNRYMDPAAHSEMEKSAGKATLALASSKFANGIEAEVHDLMTQEHQFALDREDKKEHKLSVLARGDETDKGLRNDDPDAFRPEKMPNANPVMYGGLFGNEDACSAAVKKACQESSGDSVSACLACAKNPTFSGRDMCAALEKDSMAYTCRKTVAAKEAKGYFQKHGLAHMWRPEFVPTGGFRSAYAEVGACFLDKAERLADIFKQLAYCRQFFIVEDKPCYNDAASALMTLTRFCCHGEQHLVLHGAEMACKKASLQIMSEFQKEFLSFFRTCSSENWATSCGNFRDTLDSCRKGLKSAVLSASNSEEINTVDAQNARTGCAAATKPAIGLYKTMIGEARKLYAKAPANDRTEVVEVMLRMCNKKFAYEQDCSTRFVMALFAESKSSTATDATAFEKNDAGALPIGRIEEQESKPTPAPAPMPSASIAVPTPPPSPSAVDAADAAESRTWGAIAASHDASAHDDRSAPLLGDAGDNEPPEKSKLGWRRITMLGQKYWYNDESGVSQPSDDDNPSATGPKGKRRLRGQFGATAGEERRREGWGSAATAWG